MAELTYVKSGQQIGAHTINGLIDALGGPSIPSDGDFTGTSKGALFRKSYSVGAGISNKNYEFLDVKFAEAPASLSCGYRMTYINLGRDIEFAREKLDSGHILCYDGENQQGFEVVSSDFYINGTEGEDNTPNFYDGYVCTKLSALQKFNVSTGEETKELGYGDGTLYGWKFKVQGDDADSVFVITNEYDEDTVKAFIEGQGYSDASLDTKSRLAICTKSPKGNVIIKIPNDVEFEPDEDIRFRLRGTVEKNDDGEKRFKVEYYQGYFLANDSDADTGVRWNNHQFTDITPNPVFGWHTLSVSDWMSGNISEKIPVYLNLTATYEPATGSGEDFNGQFNVSLEAAEEGRSVPHEGEEEGTNSLCSTYVIGQIDFEGDIVDVKQNILGEQTNIELFNDEAISAAVGGMISSEVQKYLPNVDSEVPLLELSSIGKYSYEDDEEGEKDVYEIYQFHNLNNQVTINDNRKKYSDIIIRTRSNTQDKKPAIVEYLPLSALSASGAEISVDTEIPNQTSSLQQLSTAAGEWYQLYNFDKTNADVPAKIWTLGDLDYDKSGKTGRLIDPTTKELLSVDILVRDNSTKQLKYMNLSVDPINVDTYSTNTKLKSLTYQRDQFSDRDFLTLRNFSTQPDTKLTAVISGNGLVDVTDQNTWILTKKYNPLNQMMELTYDKLQLSVDLSASGSEINVDTEIPNQTSSLQKLSSDDNEWYQLYNFDKTAVDLTVASDLNGPGRWYAPAPTGLTDTSALFLVKDTQSKQLKYAQLSVTPPAVDNCSIQRFWSPDFPGQPQMLSLNRFWQHPLDGTITGVLSSNNQVVTFSEPGGTGTFLMQNYLNGQLNLKYMKLQLSVDLSAVSADVKCDTDSTPAQKSIEKNAGYIQLHDFPNPTITTKKTTLTNLSATYDLLDSNDSILVRSGTELKYKKLQIETKLPGGGGSTSGYSGSIVGDCTLKWNSRGTYRIELWGKDMTYENGLLKSVGNERLISELETVGYSGS